ncbi:MAG: hypothetical protein ACT4NU_08445 [Chromatiales bacterium]
MGRILVRQVMAGLIALAVGATASAGDETATDYNGSSMLFDLVVLRPLGVAGTAIGAAAFVVALPFTVPSGSVSESARELVGKPAEYTFNRPLGELDRCGAERHPCGTW